jgi:pimeloyl-ACP methyl ester carboxylesterase
MARQDFRRFPPRKRCRLKADRPVSAVRLGLGSVIRLGLAPLGRRATRFHRGLDTAERQACGLILILPGIEGCSSVNDSIARGLSEAGCEAAIRIEDWRRFRPWNPLHLATLKHNRGQAIRIAAMISTYCCEFPGRPVHIIGHSAGAGMALFVLESLPEDCGVDSVLLLAAAVSRHYPLTAAAARIRGALWNFFSPLDLPTVGFGTTVFGTMDRRHTVSAGALGFAARSHETCLQQVCFRPAMLKQWNFGGHFGWTNAVFVRDQLAPLLLNPRSTACGKDARHHA